MALVTYIRAVDRDITKTLFRYPSHYDNLKKEERQALRSLMTRTDIVIRKADMGSATVIMSREDYINNVRCHLDNRDHYLKLGDDSTQNFSLPTPPPCIEHSYWLLAHWEYWLVDNTYRVPKKAKIPIAASFGRHSISCKLSPSNTCPLLTLNACICCCFGIPGTKSMY